MIKNQNINWGNIRLVEKKVYHFSMGDLRLAIQVENGEIKIAKKYNDPDKKEPSNTSAWDSYDWRRWDVSGEKVELQFTPSFPDLPVLIKIGHPFDLEKRANKKIFISIPLWLNISIANQKREALLRLPVVKLSKTWFGVPTIGELCYWAKSNADISYSTIKLPEHMILCPIKVVNTSEDVLKVEKFRLRGEHLSIYLASGQLWANEMKIEFKGKPVYSKIQVQDKCPKEAGSGELLSGPEKKLVQHITTKTFINLKDWTENIF